jgi:NADPH:quinone reductase-like Zn-dependent oxidoreductase
MKAVGIMDFGGPDVLEVVELPEPHAGPGQMRIRVHAAAVSPTDISLRSGARAEQLRAQGPPPYVPGMDAAGVVDEIGEGADTDLQVGDHVMAIVAPSGSHGAYSEHVVVPAESVVRVPNGASDVQAATLPMNGLTARLALDVLALRPGQTVAVTGAAGAFGGYVVQLAKTDGLTVIADASEADEKLVQGLGADVVLRRGEDFPARVRDRFPDGVDGAADGALLGDVVASAVRDDGTVITVRGYSGSGERGVIFRPIAVRTYAKARDKLDALRRLVEEGKVTPRVAGTVPKEHAAQVHRRFEAGGVRGRLVLEF